MKLANLSKMNKWKIIKAITIFLFIIFIIYLVIDAIFCMQMTYPHPVLGIDAYSWFEQFRIDIFYTMIICGIPLLIDIILMIISIVKIKKYKKI